LDEIARISDRQNGLYTTEFGALLRYRVADGGELGFGYRHVGFYNDNTGADEERLRSRSSSHTVASRDGYGSTNGLILEDPGRFQDPPAVSL
jgi:hypothetical protein